ncbi:MAG: hypothetical protein FWF40_03125 [Methanomassiliicoccaceae archaeon]|nr:hypothetical protein [Methanomassiliicoccaceae archaeon]
MPLLGLGDDEDMADWVQGIVNKRSNKNTFLVPPPVIGELLMVIESDDGIDEKDVLERLRELKDAGILHTVGFNGRDRCFDHANKLLSVLGKVPKKELNYIKQSGSSPHPDYMDALILGFVSSDPEDRDVVLYTSDKKLNADSKVKELLDKLRSDVREGRKVKVKLIG